ncbi:MAG: DUF4160 domain-containing protein [Planctomycetaceae bacterium]|nr:DUF4160 domain-containing protein [Planctomycetaceae bacterium]
MPEISRFLGIHVRLYYRDVGPPHVHAEYGEYEVIVEIETGIVSGRFPRRAMTALLEWYTAHEQELRTAAQRTADERQLDRIEPLE